MARVFLVLVLVVVCPVLAQESPSYELTEHVFNAGGHPHAGASPASASYRVTLGAVGDPAAWAGLVGGSHRGDAGFSSWFPPPGEIHGLWFSNHDTLHWDPERSIGDYHVYRDLVSDLSGGGCGACEQNGLAGSTAVDGDSPPAGDGYFYLVTARNRLHEEGTKGWDSDGLARANANPCP